MPAPKSVKGAKNQIQFIADQMTKLRNEPTKMDSSIRQQSSAAIWPSTVLQTADFNEVKQKLELLVSELRGTGKKFKDPDFEPS